jgi:hypothetical protein
LPTDTFHTIFGPLAKEAGFQAFSAVLPSRFGPRQPGQSVFTVFPCASYAVIQMGSAHTRKNNKLHTNILCLMRIPFVNIDEKVRKSFIPSKHYMVRESSFPYASIRQITLIIPEKQVLYTKPGLSTKSHIQSVRVSFHRILPRILMDLPT